MTIIGFERQRSGAKNLLVFDPMFHDASNIVKLIGRKFEHAFADMALKSYRRGNKYLRRYREFEVLRYALRFTAAERCMLTVELQAQFALGGISTTSATNGVDFVRGWLGGGMAVIVFISGDM
jgi:hypothetical protein